MSIINPYTPYKIIYHYDNWLKLRDWYYAISVGDDSVKLPIPIVVSIDPANVCNCKCLDCNADFILNKNHQCMLSPEYLDELADFLKEWGVKTACLGGGGEALCNPYTGKFIERLKNNGVGVGLVSNGTLLNRVPELVLMDWLGVSVDSGTSKTWGLVHGASQKLFMAVLDNMECLIKNGLNVTYKYLLRPENINEVYLAAKVASDIGCKFLHIRPMSPPWFEKDKRNLFTNDDIISVNEQIETAKIDFKDVQIIGVFNKVNSKWQIEHPFKTCFAIFATCVFMADNKVVLCCDHRGNKKFEVGPFKNPIEILDFWGSKKHLAMQCNNCFRSCSRCTFKILNCALCDIVDGNELMENFI